jgi:hypothetical protein
VVDQDLKPSDFVEETVRLNTGTFQRAGDGTWSRRTLSEGWEKPEQLCTNLSPLFQPTPSIMTAS